MGSEIKHKTRRRAHLGLSGACLNTIQHPLRLTALTNRFPLYSHLFYVLKNADRSYWESTRRVADLSSLCRAFYYGPALFLSHASALSQLQAMPSMLWVVTSAENSGSNIAKCQTMHRLKNGRLCSKEHTKLISPLHLYKPKGQIACHSLGSSGPFGELQTPSTIFLELAAEPETGL